MLGWLVFVTRLDMRQPSLLPLTIPLPFVFCLQDRSATIAAMESERASNVSRSLRTRGQTRSIALSQEIGSPRQQQQRQQKQMQQKQQQQLQQPRQPIPSALSTRGELVVLNHNDHDQNDGSDDASDTTHISPNGKAPSTQRQKLLRKADEGDFQARLNLISEQEVELELEGCFRRDQPSQTILDFLQHPDNDLTPVQAAEQVLNELADKTEETALTTVFVWRYMQLNKTWTTHENPKLRSDEAFLRSLANNDIIMANIIMGTITQTNKRRNIKAIHTAWGPAWFDMIPKDLLDPKSTSPFKISRRLLLQIAALCKQGVTLMEAIVEWRAAIEARLVGQVPRSSYRKRVSKKTFIIPDDLERLNRMPATLGRGVSRAAQISGVKQDRIQLKGPPMLRTIAPKPSLKRKQGDQVEGADEEHAQKRLSKDRTKQLVRVRDHLISRLVSPPTPGQGDDVPTSGQKGFDKSILIEDTDKSEAGEDDMSEDSGLQSCEASIVLERLVDQMGWSQDSRKCCVKCKKVVESVRRAIDHATAVIQSSHL